MSVYKHNSTPSRHAGFRRGFTLVEILMALGIIVVLVGVGWLMIYKIIDPASRESAQNQISAALGAARAKAITLNKCAGVLFYIDPRTSRVAMATVVDTFGDQSLSFFTDVLAIKRPEVVMDLADTEFRLLPPGVTVQFVDNCTMSRNGPLDDQLVGFNRIGLYANGNTPVALSTPIGGLILFDGHGELVCRRWAVRFNYPMDSFGNQMLSPMAQLIFYEIGSTNNIFANGSLNHADILGQYLPDQANAAPTSCMGVALVDRNKFETNVPGLIFRQTGKSPPPCWYTSGGQVPSNILGGRSSHASSDMLYLTDAIYEDAQFDPNGDAASRMPAEFVKEKWILENANIFMVSRFTGTLIDTRGQK